MVKSLAAAALAALTSAWCGPVLADGAENRVIHGIKKAVFVDTENVAKPGFGLSISGPQQLRVTADSGVAMPLDNYIVRLAGQGSTNALQVSLSGALAELAAGGDDAIPRAREAAIAALQPVAATLLTGTSAFAKRQRTYRINRAGHTQRVKALADGEYPGVVDREGDLLLFSCYTDIEKGATVKHYIGTTPFTVQCVDFTLTEAYTIYDLMYAWGDWYKALMKLQTDPVSEGGFGVSQSIAANNCASWNTWMTQYIAANQVEQQVHDRVRLAAASDLNARAEILKQAVSNETEMAKVIKECTSTIRALVRDTVKVLEDNDEPKSAEIDAALAELKKLERGSDSWYNQLNIVAGKAADAAVSRLAEAKAAGTLDTINGATVSQAAGMASSYADAFIELSKWLGYQHDDNNGTFILPTALHSGVFDWWDPSNKVWVTEEYRDARSGSFASGSGIESFFKDRGVVGYFSIKDKEKAEQGNMPVIDWIDHDRGFYEVARKTDDVTVTNVITDMIAPISWAGDGLMVSNKKYHVTGLKPPDAHSVQILDISREPNKTNIVMEVYGFNAVTNYDDNITVGAAFSDKLLSSDTAKIFIPVKDITSGDPDKATITWLPLGGYDVNEKLTGLKTFSKTNAEEAVIRGFELAGWADVTNKIAAYKSGEETFSDIMWGNEKITTASSNLVVLVKDLSDGMMKYVSLGQSAADKQSLEFAVTGVDALGNKVTALQLDSWAALSNMTLAINALSKEYGDKFESIDLTRMLLDPEESEAFSTNMLFLAKDMVHSNLVYVPLGSMPLDTNEFDFVTVEGVDGKLRKYITFNDWASISNAWSKSTLSDKEKSLVQWMADDEAASNLYILAKNVDTDSLEYLALGNLYLMADGESLVKTNLVTEDDGVLSTNTILRIAGYADAAPGMFLMKASTNSVAWTNIVLPVDNISLRGCTVTNVYGVVGGGDITNVLDIYQIDGFNAVSVLSGGDPCSNGWQQAETTVTELLQGQGEHDPNPAGTEKDPDRKPVLAYDLLARRREAGNPFATNEMAYVNFGSFADGLSTGFFRDSETNEYVLEVHGFGSATNYQELATNYGDTVVGRMFSGTNTTAALIPVKIEGGTNLEWKALGGVMAFETATGIDVDLHTNEDGSVSWGVMLPHWSEMTNDIAAVYGVLSNSVFQDEEVINNLYILAKNIDSDTLEYINLGRLKTYADDRSTVLSNNAEVVIDPETGMVGTRTNSVMEIYGFRGAGFGKYLRKADLEEGGDPNAVTVEWVDVHPSADDVSTEISTVTNTFDVTYFDPPDSTNEVTKTITNITESVAIHGFTRQDAEDGYDLGDIIAEGVGNEAVKEMSESNDVSILVRYKDKSVPFGGETNGFRLGYVNLTGSLIATNWRNRIVGPRGWNLRPLVFDPEYLASNKDIITSMAINPYRIADMLTIVTNSEGVLSANIDWTSIKPDITGTNYTYWSYTETTNGVTNTVVVTNMHIQAKVEIQGFSKAAEGMMMTKRIPTSGDPDYDTNTPVRVGWQYPYITDGETVATNDNGKEVWSSVDSIENYWGADIPVDRITRGGTNVMTLMNFPAANDFTIPMRYTTNISTNLTNHTLEWVGTDGAVTNTIVDDGSNAPKKLTLYGFDDAAVGSVASVVDDKRADFTKFRHLKWRSFDGGSITNDVESDEQAIEIYGFHAAESNTVPFVVKDKEGNRHLEWRGIPRADEGSLTSAYRPEVQASALGEGESGMVEDLLLGMYGFRGAATNTVPTVVEEKDEDGDVARHLKWVDMPEPDKFALAIVTNAGISQGRVSLQGFHSDERKSGDVPFVYKAKNADSRILTWAEAPDNVETGDTYVLTYIPPIEPFSGSARWVKLDIPAGTQDVDNTSVTTNDASKLTLYGFDAAPTNTIPFVVEAENEDGSRTRRLEWREPDDKLLEVKGETDILATSDDDMKVTLKNRGIRPFDLAEFSTNEMTIVKCHCMVGGKLITVDGAPTAPEPGVLCVKVDLGDTVSASFVTYESVAKVQEAQDDDGAYVFPLYEFDAEKNLVEDFRSAPVVPAWVYRQ